MENSIKNNQFISLLTENKYRVFRHLMILSLLMIFVLNARDWQEYSGYYEYYNLLSAYFIIIGLIYVNMYILVPKLFFKAYYFLYLIIVIILVALTLIVIKQINLIYFEPHRIIDKLKWTSFYREIISSTIFFCPFIIVSTTLKLFQRWVQDINQINALNNLTLEMELNELKNQINPHFLFNMLNNVSFLIKKNPEKASFTIQKLSEFLRYQLYENNHSKVSLTSEISFLTNFLNLEKIRRDAFHFNISVGLTAEQTEALFIPPNLFTTFVENAIKHSVTLDDTPTVINIDLTRTQNQLIFSCENTQSNDLRIAKKDPYNGLGLSNIKRRLELLYGKNHELRLNNAETFYQVALHIPIAETV